MDNEKFESLMDDLACSTFHMNDDEARVIIDGYLKQYPELLEKHDREWFYKYF